MRNILTIDVEDWFHILGMDGVAPGIEEWKTLESRVETNTRRLMDILEESNVTATFFCLGWIGKEFPTLVREIAERGFEVGCHGNVHTMVHTQTEAEFRTDIREAKAILEDASGGAVQGIALRGFRSPRRLLAFRVLREEGFRYDASVFPGSHAHGGFDVPFDAPFVIETGADEYLYEFPVASTRIGERYVAFGGGGYFRLLPGPVTERLIQRMNRSQVPATVYLHPREIDPNQPRIDGLPLVRRLKYYVNLGSTERKLRALVKRVPFTSVSEFLESPESRFDACSRVFCVAN